MPEIALYSEGLPPKAGGVPDMPLDRESRGRVDLRGLGAQARATGRAAAEAILAGQQPLLPENLYAGLERGQQQFAAGVEHLGGVMEAVAVRQQEAQNYLDVSRADNAMQETYAAHLAERERMDPMDWAGDLQKRLETLPAQWQGNQKISPAAQERIADRFKHFGTMRQIETQAQVVGAQASEARGIRDAKVDRAVALRDRQAVMDAYTETEAIHANRPGEAARGLERADQAITENEIRDLDAEIKATALDPNGDFAPIRAKVKAMAEEGKIPQAEAELQYLQLDNMADMKVTRRDAAINPFQTLERLTKLNAKKDGYEAHPEWSEEKRQQHLEEVSATIADWDRRGVAYAKNALAVGKWKSGAELKKDMEGTVSPHVLNGLVGLADGNTLDEARYAETVTRINAVDVVKDADPDNPRRLLDRTRLETEASLFPQDAQRNLNAMIAERYSEAGKADDFALKEGEKRITDMFKRGQFGEIREQATDPVTGEKIVKEVKTKVVPKSVGWIFKRPGTAADAVGKRTLIPAMRDRPLEDQTSAFRAYNEALEAYKRAVRGKAITDPAQVMEEVNKATGNARLKIYPNVTPSVTDPRAINPALNPLQPGGLPTSASPAQKQTRMDELIRQYGGPAK